MLIGLDIETSNGRGGGSFEPRDPGSSIALIQMSHENGDIEVLRPSPEVYDRIRRYIDDGALFIIHNALFEIDWFRVKAGIEFKNVWCAMIASQILNAGKTQPDKASELAVKRDAKNLDHLGLWEVLIEEDDDYLGEKSSSRFLHNLQAVAYRYGNKAVIQKDQGDSDWSREPLTEEQLRYAKDDVRYLHTIYHTQKEYIAKFGLERVAELEMRAIFPTSTMTTSGVKIHREDWLAEATRHGEMASAVEGDLNLRMGTELAEREGEVSLFGTVVPRAFNVSSPSQLAKFFGVESADEDLLRTLNHPLIPDILEFRKNRKVYTTYGEKYMSFIREDGRLHPRLAQAETATGRYSSSRPNLQNVPRDMFKMALDEDDGYVLITADYSAVESRILAYAAKDEAFIDSVNSTDVHWANAKKIFKLPEDAQRYTYTEENGVMHRHDTYYEVNGETIAGDLLRTKSKVLTFSIPYGVSAFGVMNRGIAETEEEAQGYLDDFANSFPKVQEYLQYQVKHALTKGYTQDLFGRIRWFEIPPGLSDEDLKKRRRGIAREAMNMTIQALSASITKLALVLLNERFQENGHGSIVLTVHDSIISRVKREYVFEAAKYIKEIMESCGPAIIPGIITPVDVEPAKRWESEFPEGFFPA